MTDDSSQEEMNPAAPRDGQLAPWLADFRQQVGPSPIDDAIVAVQQHTNEKNVADANTAEGDDFVNNMASVKNGLMDVVTKDPTATDTALSVAHTLVGSMVRDAGVPEDKHDDTHNSLSDHIQQQIVHAAVQSMADKDGPAARAMLNKYEDHFSDEQRGVTAHYISAMELARGMDNEAQSAQLQSKQAAASQANAFGYAQGLLDPRTEGVTFPNGWMQSLMKDTSVAPEEKKGLFDLFTHLRVNGDAPASDGFLAHDMLRGMADEIDPGTRDHALSEAGKGLRFADAQMIHGMALRNTPEAAAEVRNLTSTLDQVRDLMTGRSGIENGAAGANAFNKFVNWLLPSYRQTAGNGLNPAHESYLFANATPSSYAPSADDMPRGRGTRSRSLGEIFGG